MPTNYPTSLDDSTSLPARSSGDNIPPSDSNDKNSALIALETKIGIGDSSPNVVGRILTVQDSSGITGWSEPPAIPLADNISFTSSGTLTTGNVQSAINELDGATVHSVVAGSGVSVDSTDPLHPVVSAVGGGGGGGGGGMWTLVSSGDLSTNFSSGGDFPHTSITGLDGDTDKMYKLVFQAHLGTASNMGLCFNAVDSGSSFYTALNEANQSSTLNNNYNVTYWMPLIVTTRTATEVFSEVIISAASGNRRSMLSRTSAFFGSGVGDYSGGHFWTNTTDNITSLFIDVGAGTLSGPYWLYKVA